MFIQIHKCRRYTQWSCRLSLASWSFVTFTLVRLLSIYFAIINNAIIATTYLNMFLAIPRYLIFFSYVQTYIYIIFLLPAEMLSRHCNRTLFVTSPFIFLLFADAIRLFKQHVTKRFVSTTRYQIVFVFRWF